MAKRRQMRKRRKILKMIKLCLISILVVVILFSFGKLIYNRKKGPVVIHVNDATMLQDHDIPEFTADLSSKRSKKMVLDEKTGYTFQDLMNDMAEGDGISIKCKADGSKEGKFPIKAKVTDKMKDRLANELGVKIKFVIENGTLEVQNKFGQMDGDKFKLWDETYASDQMIPYHGKTYYFDKKGNKVTGHKTINDKKYLFDKDGVMQTGFVKEEDATYYYDEKGVGVTGWLQKDDKTYYFDKDGKMVVKDMTIGTKNYKFDKNGVLTSSEYKIDPDKPMIALTFDDGPGPRTDELLDVLDEHGARATFFMLGKKIANYPDVVKKMHELGNQLANHSWDHSDLAKLDAAGVHQQIDDTNAAIEEASGYRPTAMRPPYGSIDATVRESAGLPLVMWSLDTLDWKTRSTQATIDAVMDNVKDGDIILIHDIHDPSVDAAIALIPQLIDEGYQLVTVSEMAKMRGVEMVNGEKYFNFQ